MNFNFDIRGNLIPYELVETDYQTFREIFVESFDSDTSNRYEIFKNYEVYLEEINKITNHPFSQWINGSFVSNKPNPKDIDLVSILHFEDYQLNQENFERNLVGIHAREKYGVDAYVIPDFPTNHPNHVFSKSDKLYWRNLFSNKMHYLPLLL